MKICSVVLLPALITVFSDNLFSLRLDLIKDYFQHDFTWNTDEADVSVLLAEL